MSRFTNTEKAKEAKREAEMRKYVYGKKSPTLAPIDEKRIAMMEEIAEEYARLAEGDRLV